jgi:hypothetical protein
MMPGFAPIGSLPIADAPELDVIGAAAWSFQGETEGVGSTPFAAKLEAGEIELAFAADIDLRSL